MDPIAHSLVGAERHTLVINIVVDFKDNTQILCATMLENIMNNSYL